MAGQWWKCFSCILLYDYDQENFVLLRLYLVAENICRSFPKLQLRKGNDPRLPVLRFVVLPDRLCTLLERFRFGNDLNNFFNSLDKVLCIFQEAEDNRWNSPRYRLPYRLPMTRLWYSAKLTHLLHQFDSNWMFARPESNESINLTSPNSGNITFGMKWQTKLIEGKRKEKLLVSITILKASVSM